MRIKALFVLLLVGVAFTACSVYDNDQTTTVVSVSSEMSVSGPTVAEMRLARLNLHRVLTNEAVALGAQAPVVVQVTEQELLDLAVQDQEEREVFPGPKLVGMVKPVFAVVDLAPVKLEVLSAEPKLLDTGAIRSIDDGGFVWTTAVRSEGAQAVRVHISDMSLPINTELFVYNAEGQAHGPYAGTGPNDTGEFWTPSVNGSELFVQVRHYGMAVQADLISTWFIIDQIGHIDPSAVELGAVGEYGIGTRCYGAECVENASCSDTSHLGGAESAVAHYQYIKRPYIYMCSGGLLADSVTGTDIPYFLSANHCVGKQKYADTAEFFFDYAMPCGTDCGDPEVDAGYKVAGGAEILSTDSTSDYVLMQINGPVPAGRVFLGWNNAEIAFDNGAGLFRLAHPNGGPLSYSTHGVDTAKGTCASWPRGDWIYSTDTFGATEGGSSGSPVLNSAAQVVGQLSGGCGTNIGDDCDTVNNATVDGAFARYYDQVSQWLGDGGSGEPTCTDDPTICVGDEICCGGQCVMPPACPECDDGNACTTDTCVGAGTCDVNCDNAWVACGPADGCCGPTCSYAGGDVDCPNCLPLGAACTDGIECCSNKCRGKPGGMICR